MDNSAAIRSLDDKMKKTLQSLKVEFSKIRGNRATPAMLDDIKVDCYGSFMPINQLGTISTPEARLIVITPWDKGVIAAIEKAIQTSSSGLSASNDGNVIRLTLPPLSEERRRDLVKVVKKIAEETRVALRNERRDANETIKSELKAKTISEDDEKRLLKKIQDMTDEYVRQVDQIGVAKEKDIMEV